jgi:SARP family transcriptional regulator, regulator of embCAB operon
MLRIYLAGRLDIEQDDTVLEAHRFPGRQGRRAFAYLACERGRPVPRQVLAEAVWGDALPPAWDVALSALVSKLRRLLSGLDESASIATDFGCYQLRLPHTAWLDLEEAARAVDDAEGAVRAGKPLAAWAPANVAVVIARRPFLPGEEGEWVEQRRQRLRALLVRALDAIAEAYLANGEGAHAVDAAAEVLTLEPFRETGYQRLMRVHSSLGNRAEALRVYEQCRRLLADELGTDPSPETEALYLSLLA